jgi:catechol 2,3-dioxygenase-like lactoylglutathione lyase family enzyme
MRPARLNHAGLTVTDIDEAVSWYATVFGLRLVFGPAEMAGPGRSQVIFGAGFGVAMRAVMSDDDGVALELFQFVEPPTIRRDENFEYWKTGFFHVCLTCPDVPAQLEAVAAAGGRARTEPLEAGTGRLIAYCEDPFGNILELTNRSIQETYPMV